MGPGPRPQPGEGPGAHTPEASGRARAHRRVCRWKRNGSSRAGAHAGGGGAGPALCRAAGNAAQAQANPSVSSLPCGRPLCCPTCQGRKEGHVPTGTLPSASAQVPSPRRHRGPRTLSPDVVVWEGQPGEAVRIRLRPGAAGPRPSWGALSRAARPSRPSREGTAARLQTQGLRSWPRGCPHDPDLCCSNEAGPSLLSKIRTLRVPPRGACSLHRVRLTAPLTPGAGSIVVRNCFPVGVAPPPASWSPPLPGQVSAVLGEVPVSQARVQMSDTTFPLGV